MITCIIKSLYHTVVQLQAIRVKFCALKHVSNQLRKEPFKAVAKERNFLSLILALLISFTAQKIWS